MHSEKFLAIVCAAFAVLLSACQSEPTPTLVPIPTATYIPTETEQPAPSDTEVVPTSAPIRAVVTDTLRVREQPSTSARILGRLKEGTAVMLLARKDDNQWYEIEYPSGSGQAGWIASDIVVPDSATGALPVGFNSPAPPPGSVFARVKHNINVRTGPSKDYEVIATLPAGARVPLLARLPGEQWYLVRYSDIGKRGWILGDFLDFESAPDQLALATPPPAPTPAPTPIPRRGITPPPPGATAAPLSGHILISSNRGGGFEIYSVADNGAIRSQLTHFGESYGARFAPDGTRLVFFHIVATSPAVTSHIYSVNADGSGLVDLSRGGASDSDPDWSPDGKQIAFVRTGRASAPEIWVMNGDGSGAHRIVQLSATTSAAGASVENFSPQPRWSPDGGRLAYAAVPRGTNSGAAFYPQIYVASVSGGNETQLTDNDLINTAPVWSSDGNQIAWAAKDFIKRQNWRVWAMNASGGNKRVLIANLFGDVNSGVQPVEWIGSQLMIAGWSGNWNAYLANADGSNLNAVTREGADDKPTDWLP